MTIKPGLLYNVSYAINTEYGGDAGQFQGVWTGKRCADGRLTFTPIEGVEENYYLHPHELIEVWPVYEGEGLRIGVGAY